MTKTDDMAKTTLSDHGWTVFHKLQRIRMEFKIDEFKFWVAFHETWPMVLLQMVNVIIGVTVTEHLCYKLKSSTWYYHRSCSMPLSGAKRAQAFSLNFIV